MRRGDRLGDRLHHAGQRPVRHLVAGQLDRLRQAQFAGQVGRAAPGHVAGQRVQVGAGQPQRRLVTSGVGHGVSPGGWSRSFGGAESGAVGDFDDHRLRALVVQRLAQGVVEERGEGIDQLQHQAEPGAVPEQRRQAQRAPPAQRPAEAQRLVGGHRHRPDPHHPLAEGLPAGGHGGHLVGQPERGGDQQDHHRQGAGLFAGHRQAVGGVVAPRRAPEDLLPVRRRLLRPAPDEPAVDHHVQREDEAEVDQPGDEPTTVTSQLRPCGRGSGGASGPARVTGRWRPGGLAGLWSPAGRPACGPQPGPCPGCWPYPGVGRAPVVGPAAGRTPGWARVRRPTRRGGHRVGGRRRRGRGRCDRRRAAARAAAGRPAGSRRREWAHRANPRRPSTAGSRYRRGRRTNQVERSRGRSASLTHEDTLTTTVPANSARRCRGAYPWGCGPAAARRRRRWVGPTGRRRRVRRRLRHARKCYRLPRASCSRSIASNSALKLPLPKPSEPCRSISSKKTVGRSCTGLVKICSR